jgi:hypothetical protein
MAVILLAAFGARAETGSDIRQGLTAVGASASDQAALRAATATGEPSPGFRLGAALAAWRNAAATLDFDLHNPSGDGDDREAIGIDCFDEAAAFTHLEAARLRLGLTAETALSAAGVTEPRVLAAWRARQAARPAGCR